MAAATPRAPEQVAQLVVKVADEASSPAIAALDRRVNVVDADALAASELTTVVVAEQDANRALAALNADPRVEYAERDVVLSVAGHPEGGREDWWPAETATDQVWSQPQIGAPEVVIAVIDTGIDTTHPDLLGASFTAGYDYVNGDSDPADDNGHGTAVAGVIAAQHNEVGSQGVCPRCSIMPLKALREDGTGYGSRIAAAVDHAVINKADIINLSLGGVATDGTEFSETLRKAVERAVAAGVLVVGAAGNQGTTTRVYPAAYDGVLAVAGSDHNDVRYSWSSYGVDWVDVAAPGWIYGPALHPDTLAHGYANSKGTSFAAPLVAGIAGLLKAGDASATASQMSDALQASAVPVAYAANGRVHAAAAVAALGKPRPSVTSSGPSGWNGGSIEASAVASPGDGGGALAKVDFLVDGAIVSTDTEAPYTAVLDTAPLPDGSRVLSARATDAVGLHTTTTTTLLLDNTAPVVTVTAPIAGQQVSGTTDLSATLTDVSPVTVNFAVGDTVVGTDTTAPYGATLDTTELTDGEHGLLVTATDAVGNTTTSTRSFSVENVATPIEDEAPAPSTDGGGGGGTAPPPAPEPSASPTPSPSPSATPTPVVEFTDAVTAEAVAGDTVTTDGADATATAQRPLQVGVTTPVAGDVSIRRSLQPTTSQPSGYQLLGVETVIQAPAATAGDPLLLTFRLHGSTLPAGRDADDLEVLRNGVVVSRCTGAGATPDPCLAGATWDGDEAVLSVRTSRASVWNAAVATAVCPQPAATRFTDVSATNIHAAAIGCAVELSVARGVTDSSYQPAGSVTRAQMATFIANAVEAAGAQLPAGRDAFRDDDRSLHETAINRIAAAGIVQGVSAGRYAPDAQVTREQMATFLVRAYEYLAGAPLAAGRDAFSDDDGRAHEASINKAAAAGLASGVTARRFAPRADVRRDQMATFVVRLLDRAVAQGLT